MFAELVNSSFNSRLVVKDLHGTVHLEAEELPAAMTGDDAAQLLADDGWKTGEWRYELGGRYTCYSVTKDEGQ